MGRITSTKPALTAADIQAACANALDAHTFEEPPTAAEIQAELAASPPSPIASIQRGSVQVRVPFNNRHGTTDMTSVTFDSSKALLLPRVQDPSSSSTLRHWYLMITGDNTLQGFAQVEEIGATLDFDLYYQLIEFF